MKFSFQNKNFTIHRYPHTLNKSLQPWSAADEYVLQFCEPMLKDDPVLAIYNDRFGFLSCLLNANHTYTILNFKSQEKAVRQNLQSNGLACSHKKLLYPPAELPTATHIALVKIPKSLDLFRLYLQHLFPALTLDGIVICGFMTRHFSKQMLEIAGDYFEEIEQSRAWKKSRLLILRKKRTAAILQPIVNTIPIDEKNELKQYFGVFSANNIDYATQFLMRHLRVAAHENKILDLASGNGALAWFARQHSQSAEIHLVDDSWLAVESSRFNLTDKLTHFHCIDNLDEFERNFFDLVLCNPPFHFEYETDIEISLNLFKQVQRCLKKDGRFLVVANQHLNYKVHLSKMFQTNIVTENAKYIIYVCRHLYKNSDKDIQNNK